MRYLGNRILDINAPEGCEVTDEELDRALRLGRQPERANPRKDD